MVQRAAKPADGRCCNAVGDQVAAGEVIAAQSSCGHEAHNGARRSEASRECSRSVLRRARGDHTAALNDGDTLFLHTDGLIERVGEDLDDGHRRLHAAVARHAALDLDDLVDATIADVAPAATDNGVVLALRLTRSRA